MIAAYTIIVGLLDVRRRDIGLHTDQPIRRQSIVVANRYAAERTIHRLMRIVGRGSGPLAERIAREDADVNPAPVDWRYWAAVGRRRNWRLAGHCVSRR